MCTGRDEASVGAIGLPLQRKQSTEELLRTVLRRLEHLESSQRQPDVQATSWKKNESYKTQSNQERPSYYTQQRTQGIQLPAAVTCRKCGKEGHYARGCAPKTTPH